MYVNVIAKDLWPCMISSAMKKQIEASSFSANESQTSSTRSESRLEYSPVYVPHFFIDHMGKLNDRLSDEEEELGTFDESKLCHQQILVVRCLSDFGGSGDGKASDCMRNVKLK